jgi:hypothetical protein
MEVDLARELLNELGTSLENMETQHAALLELLKQKGIVTDEQLAPHFEQAGNASNVRWRAARVRLEHLFSAAERQQEAEKEQEGQAANSKALEKESEKQGKLAEPDSETAEKRRAEAKEEKIEDAETKPEAEQSEVTTPAEEGNLSAQRREEEVA